MATLTRLWYLAAAALRLGPKQAAPTEAVTAVPERAAGRVPESEGPRATQRAEDLRHRVVVAAASGLQQRRQQTHGVALTLACMVNGGGIGGFGGGALEHPRQWLGAQWAGLFLGVPSCPEPPGAP